MAGQGMPRLHYRPEFESSRVITNVRSVPALHHNLQAPRSTHMKPALPSNNQQWSEIHTRDESWRKQLIGEISDAFVVPRYVRLFYDTFGGVSDQDFLEIGSGNGDMSAAILLANRGQ